MILRNTLVCMSFKLRPAEKNEDSGDSKVFALADLKLSGSTKLANQMDQLIINSCHVIIII